MKIIKRMVIGVLTLVLITVLGIFVYLQTTKPVYSGELTLPGLKEEVEVLYDDYGVYAKNAEDAYFALGYVHAQDRLFQMEILRRAAGFYKLIDSFLVSQGSGNVMSKFYDNQANTFAMGRFRKMLMNQKIIEERSKKRLLLKP